MSTFTQFLTLAFFASAFGAVSQDKNGSVSVVPGHEGVSSVQGTSVGLSAADQKAIVDKHNALRRKIANGQESRGKPGPQPPASNMRQMKWDADLAKAAQTLTDRCVFAHDTKIPAGSWKGYGQNLAAGSYGSWANVIQAWYDEVKDYPSNKVSKYVFVAGHYSQVVWADSYAVGCGITTCKSGWSPIYACNYGPPGNYVGSAMYKSGKAATACPSGTKPSNSLCA